MPRIARIVATGLPHHITPRGNYKQKVFLTNNDKRQYLLWIQDYSDKYGLSILAYCLMPNHVHFIGIPQEEDSLAKTFNTVHMRYSQYFNKKINANGHLWQGRFYSCALDEPHLITASRHVERNPVRAKMIRKPWEWEWSSAGVHINKEKSPIKLGNLLEIIDMSSDSWKQYIDSKENEEAMDNIRKHTMAGRPVGDIKFIKTLERKFNKRLVALPKGRPKKKENK